MEEKPELHESEFDYRASITKVRGGWTKEKIQKELKRKSASKSELLFNKEITKFDNPEEFSDNLFYHGSGRYIGDLKPSIILKNSGDFGGGYDEQFYGISLSTDRNIASQFTGTSNSGNVAPVLLKKGSIVKHLPDISDANELDDIIEELWKEGIDAVVLGDHSKEMSEKEVVVLNPRCAVVGKSNSFPVFNKPKMPSFDKEKLKEMWENSSKLYKELSLKSWEDSNATFKDKYGRDKDISTRWNSRQQKFVDFHEHNLTAFKNKEQNNVSKDVSEFLNEANKKQSKTSRKHGIKP